MRTKATPAEVKRATAPSCDPPYHRLDCTGNCERCPDCGSAEHAEHAECPEPF